MAETSLPRTESGRIQEPRFRDSAPTGQQVEAANIPPAPAQSRTNVADIPESLRTPAMIDLLATQQIQDKASQNNKLLKQADSLTKIVSGGVLSESEQAELTPRQLRAIQTGNMNSVAQQLGMVKFTMSARGQALDRSIQTLLTGMQNIRAEERQTKLDARQNIQETLATLGPMAFQNLSEEEKRKIEKEAGFSAGYLDQATERIREEEEKIEADRQRQIEREQKADDLQQKQFDLQVQQFNFQKETTRRDQALAAAKEARIAMQAQIDAANEAVANVGKGYKMEWVDEVKDGQERKGLRFSDPNGATVPMYEYFLAKSNGNEAYAAQSMISTLRSSHLGDQNLSKLLEQEVANNGGVTNTFRDTYWWLFNR